MARRRVWQCCRVALPCVPCCSRLAGAAHAVQAHRERAPRALLLGSTSRITSCRHKILQLLRQHDLHAARAALWLDRRGGLLSPSRRARRTLCGSRAAASAVIRHIPPRPASIFMCKLLGCHVCGLCFPCGQLSRPDMKRSGGVLCTGAAPWMGVDRTRVWE